MNQPGVQGSSALPHRRDREQTAIPYKRELAALGGPLDVETYKWLSTVTYRHFLLVSKNCLY